MTYTIIQPIENTNTSYKDTGRLSFYKYEDIQVLAELFAQTNACIVCDAVNDCRGGMTQDAAYTTLWPYLGMHYAGSLYLPSYLAPEKRYLDWERVQYMTDGTFDIPWGSIMNDAWLYVSSNPFNNYSPYMHEDDRLSAAGTTAGTYALFGNGDVDIKTQDFASTIGLNIPFTFKPWTDPRDIISAYQDAKQLSEYDFNVLTWNSNMTRPWAQGQAFDQSWDGAQNFRMNRSIVQNRSYPDDTGYLSVETGWQNSVFSHNVYWEKSSTNAYEGGATDPTGYHHYAWKSEQNALSVIGSHPSFERNVPVPTNAFATNCLQERKVLFVWAARRTTQTTRNGQPIPPEQTTTKYFAFIGEMQVYGTQDFIDTNGNNRGLCLRFTFPITSFEQQYTFIKNLLNWSIPTFDMTVEPDTGSYITTQTDRLEITLKGCYSLQTSHLTEKLTRP